MPDKIITISDLAASDLLDMQVTFDERGEISAVNIQYRLRVSGDPGDLIERVKRAYLTPREFATAAAGAAKSLPAAALDSLRFKLNFTDTPPADLPPVDPIDPGGIIADSGELP